VQDLQTANETQVAELSLPSTGRIIALDPGTKRIGIAVCDELRVTTRPLPYFTVSSWKKLLVHVTALIAEFDAVALVIGLPLDSEGNDQVMTTIARDLARKFTLSLKMPVCLQDERVTSYEAKSRLWNRGMDLERTKQNVDSEAAAIILEDFLASL
jgi:putative Holliday junction resolvase